MTTGRYSLEDCAPSDLVIATLAGFFSLLQADVYIGQAEALIDQQSSSHGGYRILIDILDCAIQSQEVTAAFARHVSGVPRL